MWSLIRSIKDLCQSQFWEIKVRAIQIDRIVLIKEVQQGQTNISSLLLINTFQKHKLKKLKNMSCRNNTITINSKLIIRTGVLNSIIQNWQSKVTQTNEPLKHKGSRLVSWMLQSNQRAKQKEKDQPKVKCSGLLMINLGRRL